MLTPATYSIANVQGLGCEEALVHLLNYVWPNIFETSPHVVQAVSGAIDGCRVALGPCAVLSYTLQVCSSVVCVCAAIACVGHVCMRSTCLLVVVTDVYMCACAHVTNSACSWFRTCKL